MPGTLKQKRGLGQNSLQRKDGKGRTLMTAEELRKKQQQSTFRTVHAEHGEDGKRRMVEGDDIASDGDDIDPDNLDGVSDAELREMSSEGKRIVRITQAIHELQQKTSTKNEEELCEIRSAIERLQKEQEKMEFRLKARKIGLSVSLPGLEDEARNFSLARAFRGICFGKWGKGFEKRVFQEAAAKKGVDASNDATGAYLIPTELLMAQFVELLYANTVVIESGATVLPNLRVIPAEIPKQTSGSTAVWVGENDAPTAGSAGTGSLQMTPHRLAALVKVSKRLIRNSANSIEGMIRADMNRQVSLALDLAALRGSGLAGEPLGVVNTSGISTVNAGNGTDGGTFTFDTALDMQTKLGINNAFFGRLGYIFQFQILQRLKKQKVPQFSTDTAGMPVLPYWFMNDAQIQSQLGFGFKHTTQLPTNLTKGASTDCAEVLFGNFADLLIAMWGGMELMASDVTGDSSGNAFTQNQVWLMLQVELDAALRRAESFCLCNDARIG